MATPSEKTGLRALLSRGPEIGIAILILVILGSLILPIPTIVLDMLLALSIALSIIVLLTAIYSTNPLDFNSFPGVLLLLTLFRLGLNAASTKLILAEGDAGKVIEAFGSFVVKGNMTVGVLVFLILVLINFIVITKGAGRVAEVAARFTLDAMPAKHMSIDTELQAGRIDVEEARARKAEVERAADFYGAMDGAAKFVRGDAIAGLIITGINIVGGLYVGIVQRGMPFGSAVRTYSTLTIGDGLVSQIPALIVSTAAGIIVTQAAGNTHMGEAVFRQLTRHSRALWVAAVVMLTFALIPGLPTIPFIALAACVAGLARAAGRREKALAATASGASATARSAEDEDPEAVQRRQVQEVIQTNALEIHLGWALLELADRRAGGDLLERVTNMRKVIGLELGMLIPPARIADNEDLSPNSYSILIRGVEVASGEIFPKALLAINTGDVLDAIEGFRNVKDPGYGLPATWIRPDQKIEAEAAGYMVVQPATVLATHLQETIRRNAADLLGRQEVQDLVKGIEASHPALVKGVVPEKVSLGTLHRVLQRLLKEGIPVRDMVTILESLSDAADQNLRDQDALVETVRRALYRVIAKLHQDENGAVTGIMVGPRLESALMRTFSPGQESRGEVLSADRLRDLLDQLQSLSKRFRVDGRPVPLIAPPALRVGVRRLIEPVLPDLPVISVSELPNHIAINAVASWDIGSGAAAPAV